MHRDCVLSALLLLVGQIEGNPACKNFCFKMASMAVNIHVSGWDIAQSTLWATIPTYVKKKGIKSFLACRMRTLRIRM